jgi:CO/xanthine dehydrogenase Mo-binding subunit
VSYQIIGQSVPRVDNTGKVTGESRYTADILLPGTLWAKTLRSPHSHARIVRLDTARAAQAPGVRALLTGGEVRGILYGRRYRAISVLAQEKVRFIGERVAAVAGVRAAVEGEFVPGAAVDAATSRGAKGRGHEVTGFGSPMR